jgi:hypothetical protein
MPNVFQIIAWAIIAVSVFHALRMHQDDRRLQKFRTPGTPAYQYLFVPIRWQRRLYLPEAHAMVLRLWRTLALMYLFAAVGGLLLLISS